MGKGGKGKGKQNPQGLSLQALDKGIKLSDLINLHGHLAGGLHSEFTGADEVQVTLTRGHCQIMVLQSGSDRHDDKNWLTPAEFAEKIVKVSDTFREAEKTIATLKSLGMFTDSSLKELYDSIVGAKSEAEISAILPSKKQKHIAAFAKDNPSMENVLRMVDKAMKEINKYVEAEKKVESQEQLITALEDENFSFFNGNSERCAVLAGLMPATIDDVLTHIGKSCSKASAKFKVHTFNVTEGKYESTPFDTSAIRRGTESRNDSEASKVNPIANPVAEGGNQNDKDEYDAQKRSTVTFSDRVFLLEQLCLFEDSGDNGLTGYTVDSFDSNALKSVTNAMRRVMNRDKPQRPVKEVLELPDVAIRFSKLLEKGPSGSDLRYPFIDWAVLDTVKSLHERSQKALGSTTTTTSSTFSFF
jgi:hypothetical protein